MNPNNFRKKTTTSHSNLPIHQDVSHVSPVLSSHRNAQNAHQGYKTTNCSMSCSGSSTDLTHKSRSRFASVRLDPKGKRTLPLASKSAHQTAAQETYFRLIYPPSVPFNSALHKKSQGTLPVTNHFTKQPQTGQRHFRCFLWDLENWSSGLVFPL